MNENDFEWLDFDSRVRERGGFVITITDSSIYLRSDIKNIISKKGLTHVRMRRDKYTDKIWFVFNKTGEGIKVHNTNTKQNLCICNKELSKFLLITYDNKKNLSLSDDQSNSNDYATFEILK